MCVHVSPVCRLAVIDIFLNHEETVNPLSHSLSLGCGSQSRACTFTVTVKVGLEHYLFVLLAHSVHAHTHTNKHTRKPPTISFTHLLTDPNTHTLTAECMHTSTFTGTQGQMQILKCTHINTHTHSLTYV